MCRRDSTPPRGTYPYGGPGRADSADPALPPSRPDGNTRPANGEPGRQRTNTARRLAWAEARDRGGGRPAERYAQQRTLRSTVPPVR